MTKLIFLIASILLLNQASFANDNCFIAQENNKIINQEGECKKRYSPCSSFKIVLSLMGYDSGIFIDENNPSWSLPVAVDPYINICKDDHNPRTWMRDSCLWYSRVLTPQLGREKFKSYVAKFNYGNQDITGAQGKNNGITHSWVSSSLKISPVEQVEFLQGFLDHKFPVSNKSYVMTKNIMFVQEMAGGWKLYGKTGNGNQVDKNGLSTELQQGWFVGFIEKNGRHITFASHIVDDKKQDVYASFRARNEALVKLWNIINELEK